jgi:hypothetical protein
MLTQPTVVLTNRVDITGFMHPNVNVPFTTIFLRFILRRHNVSHDVAARYVAHWFQLLLVQYNRSLACRTFRFGAIFGCLDGTSTEQ